MFVYAPLAAAVNKPSNNLSGVSAGVSVSTGLLTLVVIGGIAYLIWKS